MILPGLLWISLKLKKKKINHETLVKELRNTALFPTLTATCCATFTKPRNLGKNRFVICEVNGDLLVESGKGSDGRQGLVQENPHTPRTAE